MSSRRQILRAGAVTAAGLVAAGAATGPAEARPRRRSVFVLVAGSHGSAQVMTGLANELALRGHLAVAVDLPGHGPEADIPAWYDSPQDPGAMTTEPSSIASVTLADATARVAGVVRRAAREAPVVLVGHSLGGAVIGTVGNAVPHLIHRMVYLAGFCPVTLPNVTAYDQAEENRGSLLHDAYLIAADPADPPKGVGALRVNWRWGDPVFLGKLRDAYLQDGTESQLRAIIAGLQPDETTKFSYDNSQVHAGTWGRIPRTFITLPHDRAMLLALQQRMIREADQLTPGNPFDVHELPMSHLGPLADPGPVADLMAALP